MARPDIASGPRCFGLGAAAGLTAAAGLLLGRKLNAQAKVGHGHCLKHRALDPASGIMQQRYPLEAAWFGAGLHVKPGRRCGAG